MPAGLLNSFKCCDRAVLVLDTVTKEHNSSFVLASWVVGRLLRTFKVAKFEQRPEVNGFTFLVGLGLNLIPWYRFVEFEAAAGYQFIPFRFDGSLGLRFLRTSDLGTSVATIANGMSCTNA